MKGSCKICGTVMNEYSSKVLLAKCQQHYKKHHMEVISKMDKDVEVYNVVLLKLWQSKPKHVKFSRYAEMDFQGMLMMDYKDGKDRTV